MYRSLVVRMRGAHALSARIRGWRRSGFARCEGIPRYKRPPCRAHSYKDAYVDDVSVRASANRITGIGNKRHLELTGLNCSVKNGELCGQFNTSPAVLSAVVSQDAIIKSYVTGGWNLSQLLCRNYLAGLSEKNNAFASLRRELNISGGLAQLTMAAAKASAKSIAYFGAVESFINSSLENLGEYEYLTPDQSTLQELVYKSQTALGNYYTVTSPPKSLIGAINAVHRIDSLCTRAGLRQLINRSIANIGVTAQDGSLKITGDQLAPYVVPRPQGPIIKQQQIVTDLEYQVSFYYNRTVDSRFSETDRNFALSKTDELMNRLLAQRKKLADLQYGS